MLGVSSCGGQCVGVSQGKNILLYDGHCHHPLVKTGQDLVVAGLAVAAVPGGSVAYSAYANQSCLLAYEEE